MLDLGVKIAPSILSADFSNLASECRQVQDHVDWFHVDIMDGHFVPNLTIGPPVVHNLRKALPDAFLDCHLMVTNPRQWLAPLAKAKINQFTFHIEACQDIADAAALCRECRAAGIRASVSVKPKSELSSIQKLLDEGLVDNVLVMTVEPGFGGQSFMVEQMEKVKCLRGTCPSLDIQVDGGIDPSSIGQAKKAGANVFVAGNAIFGQEDRIGAIKLLREKCQ